MLFFGARVLPIIFSYNWILLGQPTSLNTVISLVTVGNRIFDPCLIVYKVLSYLLFHLIVELLQQAHEIGSHYR